MGEVFRAFHVGGLQEWPSQSVGAGQSLTHTNTPKLGGVPGDVAFGITTTNPVLLYDDTFSYFSAASILDVSGYINADSLTVGVGEFFTCLQLGISGVSKIALAIYNNAGVMKIGWNLVNDNGVFDSVSYANLPSGDFHFRALVYRSTDADSNDGSAYLYLNGSLAISKTGRDFYTHFLSLNRLYFGALGLDAGTSGTLYMGKLLIKNDDADPGFLDPNQLVHLWMPPGNALSQWTTGTTGTGNTLEYDVTSKLGNVPGDMKLVINQLNDTWKTLTLSMPSNPTGLSIRLIIDRRLYVVPEGQSTTIGWMTASANFLKLRLSNVLGVLKYELTAYSDGAASSLSVGFINAPNNVVDVVDIILKRAATNISGDGTAKFSVNGGSFVTSANYDNYDAIPGFDTIHLGAREISSDTGTNGELVIGKLEIRADQFFIGPIGGMQLNKIYMPDNHTEGWEAVVQGTGQVAEHDQLAYLGGIRGDMKITLNNQNATYGRIRDMRSPFIEFGLAAYIDLRNVVMATNDEFAVIYWFGGGTHLCSIRAGVSGAGARQYTLSVRRDTGVDISGNSGSVVYSQTTYPLPDAPHFLEAYIRQATTPTSNDGSFDLYVNGVLAIAVTGWDNHAKWQDQEDILIGAADGLDVGTSGSLVVGKIIYNNHVRRIGGLGPLAFKRQVQARRRFAQNRMNYFRGRGKRNG